MFLKNFLLNGGVCYFFIWFLIYVLFQWKMEKKNTPSKALNLFFAAGKCYKIDYLCYFFVAQSFQKWVSIANKHGIKIKKIDSV